MEISVKALVGGSTVFFHELTLLKLIPSNLAYMNLGQGNTNENLVFDMSYNHSLEEQKMLDLLKKGELPIIFVGRPIPFHEVSFLQNAINGKKIHKCIQYHNNPFFIYFVGELLTTDEEKSLKDAHEELINKAKQEKQNTKPFSPAKKTKRKKRPRKTH